MIEIPEGILIQLKLSQHYCEPLFYRPTRSITSSYLGNPDSHFQRSKHTQHHKWFPDHVFIPAWDFTQVCALCCYVSLHRNDRYVRAMAFN